VALLGIRDDLGIDLRGLQWIVDAYLVTLTACRSAMVHWAIASDAADLSSSLWLGSQPRRCCAGRRPSTGLLIGARALQGVARALLIPGSLALLSATVPAAQRARWIGAWFGLTGAASAVGPFAGGWLVDVASWR